MEDSDKILVSACIVTYNHEDYIRKCLEGAINQNVNFKYEVIVGVDKSTDGTLAICEEFKERYPDLIHLYKHETNLGMLGNWMHSLNSCEGKYIAVCEGDDFWTDPLKLQKQIDYLEKNPDVSMCFHPSKIVYVNNQAPNKIVGPKGIINKKEYKFSIPEVIGGRLGITTATMVFRSEILLAAPLWVQKVVFGDVALKLILGTNGKIGFIGGKHMSIYNRGVHNAWSHNEGKSMDWEEERLKNHFQVLDYYDEYTEFKYKKYVDKQKKKMLLQYILNMQKFCNFNEKVKMLFTHKSQLFNFSYKMTTLIWLNFFLGKKKYSRLITKVSSSHNTAA